MSFSEVIESLEALEDREVELYDRWSHARDAMIDGRGDRSLERETFADWQAAVDETDRLWYWLMHRFFWRGVDGGDFVGAGG